MCSSEWRSDMLIRVLEGAIQQAVETAQLSTYGVLPLPDGVFRNAAFPKILKTCPSLLHKRFSRALFLTTSDSGY
jgi:hypothetical protein